MVLPPSIDVFVSYPHTARHQVGELVRQLEQRQISVWWDTAEIAPFSAITPAIQDAIRRSTLFLIWYSADYPHRRPCQLELTSIFAAVPRQTASRILVVNPEPTAEHIHPIELRDCSRPDIDDPGGIADRVRARLTDASPRSHEAAVAIEPPWYGIQPSAFPRFVGRLPELWRIHSLLTADATAITAGRSAPRIAQLRGLGGVGKSLLALEYARRFAATYPGGVFWLSAAGGGSESSERVEEQRQRSFRDIAQALDIPVRKLDAAGIDAELVGTLSPRTERSLWIVDDLPESLSTELVRKWTAPAASTPTLITTRSRGYSALGGTLDLGVLPLEDAAELLALHRPPADAGEAETARRLVEVLGQHALALDVAGAAIAATHLYSYALFLKDLEDVTTDVLDLAGELSGALPTGHDARIAATLGRSIDSVSADGKDVLRVAAVLSAAPIPEVLFFDVLQGLWADPRGGLSLRAVAALAEVEGRSLVERTHAPAGRRVHPLVKRTIARYHVEPERLAAARQAVATIIPDTIAAHLGDIAKDDVLSLCVQHATEIETHPEVNSGSLLASLAAAHMQRAEHQKYLQAVGQRAALLESQLGPDHFETWSARITVILAEVTGVPKPHLLVSMRDAVQAQRRLRGDADLDVMISVEKLCNLLWMSGHVTETRRVSRSVYESCLRHVARDTRVALRAEHLCLKYTIPGSDAQAREASIQALRRVLETRRRVLGPQDGDTLASLTCLSGFVDDDEARQMAREVYETALARHGPGSAETASVAALYASKLGHTAEAADLYAYVLSVYAKLNGLRHESTTMAAWNYRAQLRHVGREREADDIDARYLAWTRRAPASDLRGFAPMVPALLDGRQLTGTMLVDPEATPPSLPLWIRLFDMIDGAVGWMRRMRGRMQRPTPAPEAAISVFNQPDEVLWRLESPDGVTISAVLFTHRLGTALRFVGPSGASESMGLEAQEGESLRSKAERYRDHLIAEGWRNR